MGGRGRHRHHARKQPPAVTVLFDANRAGQVDRRRHHRRGDRGGERIEIEPRERQVTQRLWRAHAGSFQRAHRRAVHRLHVAGGIEEQHRVWERFERGLERILCPKHFADVGPPEFRQVVGHLVECRCELTQLVARPDVNPLAETALADGVRAAGQPPQGPDDGVRQVPRHRDGDAECSQRDQQHGSTGGRGLVPGAPNGVARELEVPVADLRGQRHGTAQQWVGGLVVLHQRVPFGGDGDHAIGRTPIRRQLVLQRPRERPLVFGPENVEEIGDRFVHDRSLPGEHGGSAAVACEHEEDGIVLALERPGQTRRDGGHRLALTYGIGDHATQP